MLNLLRRPQGLRAAESTNALIERDPARLEAAHLLRRATMAPHPDQIEAFAERQPADNITSLLSEGTKELDPPEIEDSSELSLWWLRQMLDPKAGLGERMTWFWHTHLTTNSDKVGSENIGAQLGLLRRHALGNYRELLQGFVIDGALLQYLDGSYSVASNPNENLGRELMELFTIGRSNYSQDDVQAASRALAGWIVDEDGVRFERENAFNGPLLFLGVQQRWDTTSLVDHLCDHPATAMNVSSKLWRHLTGEHLDEPSIIELGKWWQSVDLEILPLVERILTNKRFFTSRLNRPRTGIEWWCATRVALGTNEGESIWPISELGQMPFLPPNVAGWPDDDRWLSGGSLLGRSSMLFNTDYENLVGTDLASTEEVLDRCGLYEVSPSTIAALDSVADEATLSDESKLHLRWRAALSSPEFNLS